MAGFKARARALDMLGRQQIAGIPTAISELFKNAHDAYADNVIVDYFRSDGLFVLRDDGLGMTVEDFEERWLTLGTESKLIHKNVVPPPKDPSKPERSIMGEKGIGRLAIASIGDHVLILTRAKRENKIHDLVMAFVYWRLYEIPGINLDQIDVPTKTITEGKLPSVNDFEELNNKIIDNILRLQKQDYLSDEEGLNLLRPLENLSLIAEKIDKYLEGPSLINNGHGTHFIICPADQMLKNLIDDVDKPGSAPPIVKTLLGFTNTMFPYSPEPIIATSFRDHKNDEYFSDLIAENQFWTPEDYLIADHKIKGKFDEYGQFRGSINVYGKEFKDHIINWTDNKGLKTNCGPFDIDVAYFQGSQKDSKIPTEDWARINAKLEKIAGVYLYRDNIRILPYGDHDFDWLDIEENRNKSAGYYFFSYRRMFGAIIISNKTNNQLNEKAGREGLRENIAYKQLRSILKNFFVQLAADFFRETERWKTQAGPNTEYWTREKERLQRLHKAKEEFEKKARAKKEKFQKQLNIIFERIKNKEFQEDYNRVLSNLKNDLEHCLLIKDNDEAISKFLNIEKKVRTELYEIQDSYYLSKPRGVALNKQLIEDYTLLLGEYAKIEDEALKPAFIKADNLFTEYQSKLNAEISRRKRLEIAIENTVTQYKKETSKEVKDIQATVRNLSQDVINYSKQLTIEFENKVRVVNSEIAKINPYELNDESLVSERNRLESELITIAENIKTNIDRIKNQLDTITVSEEFSNLDFTEVMAEELEGLRAKIDADLELTQLGLAVSAIQHEFMHTTKTIRNQIRRLKAWADLNEGIEDIYKSFSTNFEHLDNYLTLFTPLSRRLYRKEVKIYGNDVFKFIEDVFYTRMSKDRHNIKFDCSQSFANKTIMGYPSTFYPVYVNIIDNAIFWLKDQPHPRKILLDADKEGIYISNNGPGIDIRDFERIFDLGFTR
ncbi:MAG: ATP-binding protein, partial [Bacteroidales bacterium]|nr:ATP-binding protein [Bacteroidales bacterium]